MSETRSALRAKPKTSTKNQGWFDQRKVASLIVLL